MCLMDLPVCLPARRVVKNEKKTEQFTICARCGLGEFVYVDARTILIHLIYWSSLTEVVIYVRKWIGRLTVTGNYNNNGAITLSRMNFS